MKLKYYLRFLFVLVMIYKMDALYYDGDTTYSIYPRLDLQICANSSLSFDFSLSLSSSKEHSYIKKPTVGQYSARILLYSEQQIQVSTVSNSKKLINSYFLIKYLQPNRLIINDYWNINDVQIKLPNDFATSWYRLVYTRTSSNVDISLYKFESTESTANNRIPSIRLKSVFSKQLMHSNFVLDEFNSEQDELLVDSKQVTYSKLFVGGVGENPSETNYALNQLKQLGKFHGYIMNLQYTSQATQCPSEVCSAQSTGQRQYAIFSLSPSKQLKSNSILSDSVKIDDICESDFLTHDICPKDCACLSNNLIAPFFNCDCAEPSVPKSKCQNVKKSFTINFNDENYFSAQNFDYPMMPSFTKIQVTNQLTHFDKIRGIQFKNQHARVNLAPSGQITPADSCFWNIEDCVHGFSQHMLIYIDRLDDTKYNSKVVLFENGQADMSKFVAFVYKNRLHFSLFEQMDAHEWIVSSFVLDRARHLSRELKITVTWLRDKYMSLHIDGFLIDMTTKPSSPAVNQDVYTQLNALTRFYYEIGVRSAQSESMFALSNHQFTIKWFGREYFNEPDAHDSKIIVSSPLPSEIIRIDNTQRVMYKIDSPLSSVSSETIELSFRTTQSDGVVFYIRNNPIITYFELVRGQPVIVIDTRVKNFYLRPQTAPLNDNQWHEIKLHRDRYLISINIDSQYHDMCEMMHADDDFNKNRLLTGGYVYLGLADPNNINLSDKKTFVGEMVRGKVTINNVQQKVVQQPYYWPSYGNSVPATLHTTNQTVNIDTSQITQDGKMINIVINVYGPPGLMVNAAQKAHTDAETHLIYLDNLPDTRYISVGAHDTQIDFQIASGNARLDSFMIKFQTRQTCGQLVVLTNQAQQQLQLKQQNKHNNYFIAIEIYNGYLYATTSLHGVNERHQISRVRVDDGRIYQVNLEQQQQIDNNLNQNIVCWLESDDAYKQSIYYSSNSRQSVMVNTIRVGGQDASSYGLSSQFGFVGCIGAILFNQRDVIDYQVVPSERRQSCQQVIDIKPEVSEPVRPVATPAPPTPPPTQPVSLGYISFTSSIDILVYNYFYDHERPQFEDVSFIFRTVESNGILFSAHNNEDNHNQVLIGAYIRQGLVHVVYKNYSYTQEIYFNSTLVDDGNLYRLNIRRNLNGHGFIQLQSYVGVTALEFYTQPGHVKFSKIVIGGADDWSRIKYFGTKSDFVGCIIDLFQVNGNSVIKPADIPQERYNCNVQRPATSVVVEQLPVCNRQQQQDDSSLVMSFGSVDDAFVFSHETIVCEHIEFSFRTRQSKGIIYSHVSNDALNYVLVYLRNGVINLIVKDQSSERHIELSSGVRVDDGSVHKIDIECDPTGYLIAYLDRRRQSSSRIELYSPIRLNTYTLGYYSTELLSSRYAAFHHFTGCLQQVYLNEKCLIFKMNLDVSRYRCSVQTTTTTTATTTTSSRVSTLKQPTCVNECSRGQNECVFEINSRGFVIFNGYEAGAKSSPRDSISFSFKLTDEKNHDQDLLSVYHSQKSIRIYLSASTGRLYLSLAENDAPQQIGQHSSLNDGVWHRILIEKQSQRLFISVDGTMHTIERLTFEPDLLGSGSIYFGASHRQLASNLHGYLKDVHVKFSNVQYDILAAAIDIRLPGVSCHGHVTLKQLVDKPSSMLWRFRGSNSGQIKFVPHLSQSRESNLNFQFNTSQPYGVLMCTGDENFALKAELNNQMVMISIFDLRSRQIVKSAYCQKRSLSDNKWHKIHIAKKARTQLVFTCDDSTPSTIEHEIDIPFVNTNKGVVFGSDCANNRGKEFIGELTQITYTHDSNSYSFNDLQYSEDPRFTYEKYVEFSPQITSDIYSDPKPIFFRSVQSSAKLERWDDSKLGRISFEFKTEMVDENGILFSTELAHNLFAIAIKDGYLEAVLSPHRVPYADSSNQISSYDRYQRLFSNSKSKINDGKWHKLEFMMLGDLMASLVLDDDHSSKIRFPYTYWTEESSLTFGYNSQFRKFELPSFRGCLRNVVINNRLVNWLSTGLLDNIEVGCHGNRNEILHQGQESEVSSLVLESNGCVRYAPRTSSSQETIEFFFKTGGDQYIIFDSQNADFIVHTQGPSLVIRSRDDSNKAVIAERGIYFNDLNWHKIRLDKQDNKIKIELDDKYKQELVLTKRSSYLAPMLFGCSKSNNLRHNKLKNFVGSFKNIQHTSSNSQSFDLVKELNANSDDLILDGQVYWINSPMSGYENSANSVTLKDWSFVQLDNLRLDKNSNISFLFKTNEENALLALIDSTNSLNYLSVELSSGMVNFLIQMGRKTHRAMCAQKANDQKWHHVSIKLNRMNTDSSLTLTCDNIVHRIQLNDQFSSTVQFRSGNLSSESVRANLWSKKFSGCIQDLRINEQTINIYERTTSDSRKTLTNKCSEPTGLCQKDNCNNYGECVEGYTKWSCKCEVTSYGGERCDQPASTLSFNGSHTVEFTLKEPKQSSSERISLRFRTGLRNGVLFSLKKSKNEPSMVLSVEDGRLKCVYDRKDNDKVIYAGEVHSFNNNKWHSVNLVRTGSIIHLQLTDNQGLKYRISDTLGEDFNLITYSHVIIGGARSPSLVQEHQNFIGWMQNLNFNGHDLFHSYLNSRAPKWSHSVDGYADPGENSILLHHQITLTSECVISLPRTHSTDRFSIHLFFKTTEENGVILFRRGKNFRFMALEMRTGRLRFVFDLGAGVKQIVSAQVLNDRNWHEVAIKQFDRQKFSLKIDDYREVSTDIGTNNPGVSELESFTIGGLVPGYQKFEPHILTTKGFTGCLASIEINGDAADLYSNRLNLCPSVQHGCVDLACSSDTCSNNGQCSVLNGQVSCNCEMTSYTGAFCRDNSDYFFFGKTSQECGLIKHAIVPPLTNQENDQLAFGFTTLDTEALLVRIEGDSQYIDIRLLDGYLMVVVNLNNVEERFKYSTLEDKKFNDNTYHVVQFVRQKNLVSFRADNFEQMRFGLQSTNCVFKQQRFVYIGSVDMTAPKNPDCFYGIITGVFFNQIFVLNEGSRHGDVANVDYRYIVIDIDVIGRNRTKPLLPDLTCPLGYSKQIDVCVFSICPLNSDQIADTCSCYQGYHEMGNVCIRRNETRPAGVVGSSAKLIPAKTRSLETPIGLILGIISGIALALLAAGIGARKCSDGLCVPAARVKAPAAAAAAAATTTGSKVASMFSSTTNTTNHSYEMNTAAREQIPLIQNNEKFSKQEEFMARDTLDMGYNYFPQPIVTQSVNETMEMYEQTMGAGGAGTTTTVTTYGPVAFSAGSMSHNAAHHHSSQRDIAMGSMFFANNNSDEYELSNVNCVTMTPNGKYAIIGQSAGAPQIWDTLSGQLVRSMMSSGNNCSCLSLACNGSLLVGLSNDGPAIDSPIQSVQIWEVQTGKPIQMSHQIKCCVFEISQDTNSIYMAGNQRFGRGISVGILDLITFELTKEVKSDPTLSLGDNPESIVITPDERHAIVGCRYPSGTNFVVFDLTKASEIGQTKSIAFDADPKCIAVLNNGEVITGTRGGHLIQWNIHTCQITTTYIDQNENMAHIGPINQISISADKEHLVSGSSDGTVKVWNTINKSLISVLNGHRGEVTCVSISNNDLIVSGSTDQTVALWRLFGGSQISSMPVGMNLIEVNMAKHNKTIVAIGEKDGEQQLLMLKVINVQR